MCIVVFRRFPTLALALSLPRTHSARHPPRPPTQGFHGLWHLFVLAAAGCHYFSILAAVQAAAAT